MSFCATATPGFSYHFYVAHDHFDPFFRDKGSHFDFTKAFYQQVGLKVLHDFRLLCIVFILNCLELTYNNSVIYTLILLLQLRNRICIFA